MKLKKARVIQTSGPFAPYKVQIWRVYWPFWMTVSVRWCEEAISREQLFAKAVKNI